MMNLGYPLNCEVLRTENYQLLDVTLRDGGYCNQWCLSENELLSFTRFLSLLPLDIIEVGYMSDQNKYGANGQLSPWSLAQIKALMPNPPKIAAMLFQDEPNPVSCLKTRIQYLDLVRVPMRLEDFHQVQAIVEFCNDSNTECSINITKVSTYSLDDLLSLVERINSLSVKVIYLADSRGALYPNIVYETFSALTAKFPEQSFGFHAHNNLTLAFMNSVAAVAAGARYLDSSIAGMGMGAGNLITEQLLFHRYQESEILNSLISTLSHHAPLYELLGLRQEQLKYILSGTLNVAQEDACLATELQTIAQKRLRNIRR
ncbi:MAG: hypothetical protein H0U73_07455 [Tatlockia sp.]|nr:hypothetical protein [Tatlockia sp.]